MNNIRLMLFRPCLFRLLLKPALRVPLRRLLLTSLVMWDLRTPQHCTMWMLPLLRGAITTNWWWLTKLRPSQVYQIKLVLQRLLPRVRCLSNRCPLAVRALRRWITNSPPWLSNWTAESLSPTKSGSVFGKHSGSRYGLGVTRGSKNIKNFKKNGVRIKFFFPPGRFR